MVAIQSRLSLKLSSPNGFPTTKASPGRAVGRPEDHAKDSGVHQTQVMVSPVESKCTARGRINVYHPDGLGLVFQNLSFKFVLSLLSIVLLPPSTAMSGTDGGEVARHSWPA